MKEPAPPALGDGREAATAPIPMDACPCGDAYVGAFVRLAVSSAFDTSAAFDASLARLVGEYAALTSAKRKREESVDSNVT